MKVVAQQLVFESTGRIVRPYAGVVGLGDNDFIGGGFDQEFESFTVPNGPEEGGALNDAERRELAEHMIAAWTKIRDEAR